MQGGWPSLFESDHPQVRNFGPSAVRRNAFLLVPRSPVRIVACLFIRNDQGGSFNNLPKLPRIQNWESEMEELRGNAAAKWSE